MTTMFATRREVDALSLEPAPARARALAAARRRCPGSRTGPCWDRSVWLVRGAATLILGSCLFLGSALPVARAETPLSALAPDGLNGGRYVASGLHGQRPSLRLAGSVGYGFTERVLDQRDRHHRAAGELAIALLVAPWLQASLASELTINRHSTDGSGRETGLLGSTRLATRHVLALAPRIAIGLAPRVHFPGAQSPARGLRAASYELAALFSARLRPDLELSLNAGYRRDRSRLAHKDALSLPAPQRLAAGLTDEKNACLLGALLVAALADYRISAEWSWELWLDSPVRPSESPMRVRAALQRVFVGRFIPGVEVGVDTSSRPRFVGLTRIEPRLWARFGLTILLAREAPRLVAAPVAVSDPPAPAEPQSEPLRSVTLRVVDTHGKPIAGARVAVPGEEHAAYITGVDGQVTLQVPPGITAVTIEAPAFEPIWRTLGRDPNVTPVVLTPQLPAAEIKGVVRNLAGDPVPASVTVLPEGMTVSTDTLGQFAIGVAPGDYTLKIEADGYQPQERRAQVEWRGVTIVVVDLLRADR